ncbi:nucleotide-binding universal stress UspA family protein [Actinomycetospora succinea]|uniref:Nucleotide-binding universal stress UspA family protein n=1 Tax=Actinomycetospora succinea TaxID=663603 RepID=A0A4R6VB19_9PSEU|nr:universal stress protein [Actinomycetospora succinea]TDQ58805.1 nucleotide-binding universal stress UspA family protein [Actinomycetospora succinea]
MTAAVVVGVPLHGQGEPAVRWAAAEARDRGVALRLVHAMVSPVGSYPGRSVVGVDARRGLHDLARHALDEMAEVARTAAPGLAVEESVVEGDVVAVLRAQAASASLLVVGSDGFGLIGELALGGVARGLAGHVEVPVVVVPPETAGRGDVVVVGDDGTPGCRGALRFAARRAAERAVPLVVVRAGPDARLLPDDLPELGDARPSTLQVVLAEDRADRVLADQARAAELVVLGVGEHGWRHPRHSTRRGLVGHVQCPVVVVPPDHAAPRNAVGATRRG